MKYNTLLFENLFKGDLKHTVRNVIQIDDFESVIDDEQIVITFYFKNKDACEDASVFLERSHVSKILDTELSSQTNKDGDWLLFVEIDNSKNNVSDLFETITEIVKLVKVLSLEDNWFIKNLEHFKLKLKKYNKTNLTYVLEKITQR